MIKSHKMAFKSLQQIQSPYQIHTKGELRAGEADGGRTSATSTKRLAEQALVEWALHLAGIVELK